MKAKEVLGAYAGKQKQRNFRNVNLQGQFFKGQQLPGIDLSGADIRGANFTGADLTGAKFRGAIAGMQPQWAMSLVLVSVIVSAISGCISVSTIKLIAEISASVIAKGQSVVSGMTILGGVFTVFFISAVRKGLRVALIVAALIVALVGLPAGLALATVGKLGAGVATAATTVALTAVAVAVTSVAVGVAIEFAAAVAVVAAVWAALVTGETSAIAGIVATVALFSSYIAKRALARDDVHGFILNFAITVTATGGTFFRDANLTDADFKGATLKSTNLKGAILTRTCLRKAKKLDYVLPGETYLQYPQVQQLLMSGEVSDNNFDRKDLRGINLEGVDLTDVSFVGSDLSQAKLQNANLSKAKLVQAEFLGADLTGATLTGACIEDWKINTDTILDSIICNYVYRRRDEQERRPHGRNFVLGEFTKLYKETQETVELVLLEKIDWKAFLKSFLDLKAHYGSDDISIQAFEDKNDAFIIRINVPPGTDEAEAEKFIEEKYQLLIKDKDEFILYLSEEVVYKRQENARLQDILLEMTRIMNEKQSVKNFYQPQFGNYVETAHSGSRQHSTHYQHNYASEQEQTLAEIAVEIEQHVASLQDQGYRPEAARQEVANDLASRAQNNPTFRSRLKNWARNLSDYAAGGVIGEVAVEVLKWALKLAGISVP